MPDVDEPLQDFFCTCGNHMHAGASTKSLDCGHCGLRWELSKGEPPKALLRGDLARPNGAVGGHRGDGESREGHKINRRRGRRSNNNPAAS